MSLGPPTAGGRPGAGRRAAVVLAGLLFAACAPLPATPSPPAVAGGAAADLADATRLALDDAARRHPAERASLALSGAEAVTWSDGSLGCPQPGALATQALVPGYRVRVQAGTERLDYHFAHRGPWLLCPAERRRDPLPRDAAR